MRASFYYGNKEIEYTVAANPQLKTQIRIHVHPNGTVEVEAPVDHTERDVSSAILKRARWIDNNLQQFEKFREHSLPRQYVSGETHFYLGRRYQLKIFEERHVKSSVALKGGQIQVRLPCNDQAAVRRRLKMWYKSRAKQYLQDRLAEVSNRLDWVDVAPPIRLMQMKTQWGNCSPSGEICLNPMLIKAPRECIEYVIVHELCHLQEHNHSKRFYRLLQKQLPNWQHTKAKLDGMAELLLAE